MKILLILIALLMPGATMVQASFTGKVENIDLNLKNHEMAITFLGLSAGEATLIQGPNGENILVNTGGKNTEAELVNWLALYDVKKIQTLILSKDVQNLAVPRLNKFISKYNIKEIISTPANEGWLKKNIDPEAQVQITVWGIGTKKTTIPDLTAEVQYVGNEPYEGLDFLLRFYKHRIFLMSSLSEKSEETLMHKKLDGINVFKTPNCSEEKSLSEAFIQYLNPEISILFASEDSHPDPKILHDLHKTWSEVYFTKRHGTVTVKFTDSKYEAITIPIEEEE
ncbi:ComEC/Rec2 family competence protein [Neobacillus sp. LXY-1]|uniref:ComEC/Rec2 family competence protein n=1 Tax=Neobacillus sp. LXY-1 TaxID=3379133 RepID=UPI003EE1B64E